MLFGWVFADQAGVPVPVVPLLLGAGALAGGHELSLPMSLALAVSASLLADLLWYAVGRRRGTRALGVLCRITLEPDSCVRRAQDLFRRHGLRSLVIAKFLPAVNPLAARLAGVVGIGLGRFVLYELGCAAVWAGTWIGLGYLLSDAIEEVAGAVARLGNGSIVLLTAVLLAYIGVENANRYRFLRQLRIARIDPEELKRLPPRSRSRSTTVASYPARWWGAIPRPISRSLKLKRAAYP